MNIATTGHKLQGMTKDVIIVVRNEKWKNWLYVVLSRVKTRKGSFLYRKLDMSDIQEPDSSHLKDETRLKELEQQILAWKEKNRINKNKICNAIMFILSVSRTKGSSTHWPLT